MSSDEASPQPPPPKMHRSSSSSLDDANLRAEVQKLVQQMNEREEKMKQEQRELQQKLEEAERKQEERQEKMKLEQRELQQKLEEQEKRREEQEKKMVQEVAELQRQLNEGLEAKKPRKHTLPCSPSDMAGEPSSVLLKHFPSSPLYYNWFAVELYELYNQYKSIKSGDVSIDLFDYSFKVKSESLETICSALRTVSKFESVSAENDGLVLGVMGCEGLGACEISATGYFARELDRFLFPDDKRNTGACYHQFPVYEYKQAIEKCDFYVATLEKDGFPGHPVLVGDAKVDDMEKAKRETYAYCTRSHRVEKVECWFTNLGFAYSINRKEVVLTVSVGDDGFDSIIEICQCGESETRVFFIVLFAAVHYLINEPLLSVTVGAKPFKELEHIKLGCRTFRCDNMVYKLYDTEHDRHISPNYDIICSIAENYLPDMNLTSLTRDRRVLRLEYRYIPAVQTRTEKQFRKLFQDLEKLHRNGYVHSDIREENLVFGEDEAWMVDFDLAGKEDTFYPNAYNGKLPCRHRFARPFARRKRKHDTYSLVYILRYSFPSRQVEVDEDKYTFTLV